jgi:methylthioribose-1-phosphate isomerase
MLPTITWDKNRVILIDQRLLPTEEVYLECLDYIQVAKAIEEMAIRGAPAIGVAAAYGVALGVQKVEESDDLDSPKLVLGSRKNEADIR